jgi:hypothetical protein
VGRKKGCRKEETEKKVARKPNEKEKKEKKSKQKGKKTPPRLMLSRLPQNKRHQTQPSNSR